MKYKIGINATQIKHILANKTHNTTKQTHHANKTYNTSIQHSITMYNLKHNFIKLKNGVKSTKPKQKMC